jgi:HlyD family secretion protein
LPTTEVLPKLSQPPSNGIGSPIVEATPARIVRNRTWALLAVGLALITAVLVWRYQHTASSPVFQVARLERGTIESAISATGTCNAVVTVQVGSQVSGNIKALYADFNSRVKAGQLVALIDPELFQARVKQALANCQSSNAALENARANVSKADADRSSARAAEKNQVAAVAKAKVAVADAKAKLARRVEMFNNRIISKEDLDTAQAAYDQAVAELEAAEAQHDASIHSIEAGEAAYRASQTQFEVVQAQVRLNQAALDQARIDVAHTQITAPVDGIVVSRNMDVGQTVAASFQAPTIFLIAQDLTKMQVDTNVDEADVGRVKVGQQAKFNVDAYPGIVFQGLVKQVRKAPINVQNVITYDAVIEVANPDLKLFPGMTANVNILCDRRDNVLKLPNAALRFKPPETATAKPTTGGKPEGGTWRLVYIQGTNLKAQPVRVQLGISDGNFTEVQQGELQEGRQVIVGSVSKAPAATSAPPSMTRRL